MYTFWVWILSSSLLLAQTYNFLDDYQYRYVVYVGGSFYTHGISMEGGTFKKQDKLQRHLYFAMGSIRDPKEVRVESFYADQGGKRYVYEKINQVYIFHGGWGWSWNPIDESQNQPVLLSLGATLGPSLTLIKPYYIEVARPISRTQAVPETVIFDPNKYRYEDIIGEANFFYGIHRTRLTLGTRLNLFSYLHIRSYGYFITAIKLGVHIDAFVEPLPLLATPKDKQIFVGPYIGVYLGNAWD